MTLLGAIVLSLALPSTHRSQARIDSLIWDIAPGLLTPAATKRFFGHQEIGLGPTTLMLKQQDKWTYGLRIIVTPLFPH